MGQESPIDKSMVQPKLNISDLKLEVRLFLWCFVISPVASIDTSPRRDFKYSNDSVLLSVNYYDC